MATDTRADNVRQNPETGGTLVFVLIFLVLLTLLGMALLFTTDVELRSSDAYLERNIALSDTDSALNELLWRFNLTPGAAAPPVGSTIDVNDNKDYDASLDYDPFDLLSDGKDNDLDGGIDEPDELNLAREWELRVALQAKEPDTSKLGSDVYVVDSDPQTGPPWGGKSVVATIQAKENWRPYSTADPSDGDVLTVRFKLDTDTVVGDSEGDGAEIVFYDPALAADLTDDKTTLIGLGGDADPTNDSPYNITWSDGVTTYPASGHPVLVVSVTGRASMHQGAARRTAEIEVARSTEAVFPMAVCGCKEVSLSSIVDSYKSTEGTFGTGPIYDNGNVGSNGVLTLTGGGLVTGNSESGDETKLSGLIMKDAWAGDAIVTTAEVIGTAHEYWTPRPQPCACDLYDMPKIMAEAKTSNDNASILPDGVKAYVEGSCKVGKVDIWKKAGQLDIGSHMTVILSGGTYHMEQLKVSEYIQVGVDTDGDCLVDAPPTEPVKIYVNGDVDLSGQGIINASQRPEDLQLFMDSVSNSVDINGAFTFRGTIYAPNVDCNISGGAIIEGAIVCGFVKGGGDGIHYDEDLARRIIVDSGLVPVAWHEIR